jgi:hypothetical protein
VEPVFNLTVFGEPEFFANGLLVHNCDAFIYARRRALHHFYQADAPAKKPQAAQVDDEFDRLERERVARKSLGFMSLPDEPI